LLWGAVAIGVHVAGSVLLTIAGIILARLVFAWSLS
jgi:hypothetical protein